MLISSLRFGGEVYKAIFFLPVMATLLAMAIVWEFALHPIVGVVNDILRDGCDIGWLYSPADRFLAWIRPGRQLVRAWLQRGFPALARATSTTP